MEKKLEMVLVILMAGIVIELVVFVWIDNIYFKSGQTLDSITRAVNNLRVENMILEDKIASESSLVTIQDKASKMGFKPMEGLEFIK